MSAIRVRCRPIAIVIDGPIEPGGLSSIFWLLECGHVIAIEIFEGLTVIELSTQICARCSHARDLT